MKFSKRIVYLRNRHLFFFDILLLPIAAYLSFVLRLENFDLGKYWPAFFLFAATAVVIVPLVFRFTGVYSRYWRFASIEELTLLAGAVTVASLLVGGVSLLITAFLPMNTVPRSVPIIFLSLALGVTAGPRLLVRILSGQPLSKGDIKAKRVLIAGAGEAGQMLARDIRQHPETGIQVIGFVDDDPRKQSLTVRGLPIFGGREKILELKEGTGIDEVIIAMPSASGEAVRDIVEICKEAEIKARILPALSELLTEDVKLRHLRPVDINDLLRREPIETDLAAVYDLVRDKTVLVTGAGGSIGSELCRQITKARPQKLVLLGHGENSIFDIQNELLAEFQSGHSKLDTIVPVIADVRDHARLQQIFDEHNPEVVFHAAAHKHVPLMEANPIDAITNNILGTHTLLEACLSHDVERFVLISTDKAVNPANIMGVTKRVAELLVQDAAQKSGRAYVAVRFGNVLGSRGSVVPFFKKQIEAGGPVTVTHPEVTRYFMTIPEAVQLVLQAATMGTSGDLFMLEMGEPVKIVDLAKDLIRLSGLTPGEDIQIIFTGLRPGEKLFEELYQGHEDHIPTEHEKILRVTTATTPPADLPQIIALLHELSQLGKLSEALSLIASIVPEYRSPPGIQARAIDEIRASNDNPDIIIPLDARWY